MSSSSSSVPTNSTAANPVLVHVHRGSVVESRHRGAAVVVDRLGRVVHAWGEVGRPIYPRSAIKALQALPLIESGAADAYAVGAAELALACASHTGEARHVDIATRWLKRLGLGAGDLACGPQPPRAPDGDGRGDRPPTRLHNNCSGKHAGMLTLARHIGAPTAGYEAPDHPVQARIRGVLGAMTGVDHDALAPGVDGCGVPTYAIPLDALARAFARFAAPENLPPARAAAIGRLRAAVAADPYLVAGRGRCCTAVMELTGPSAFVKSGAEGVFVAALPDLGYGLALKIDDGAVRAAEVALLALMRYLGVLDDAGWRRLAAFAEPVVANWAGTVTGAVRAAPEWLK